MAMCEWVKDNQTLTDGTELYIPSCGQDFNQPFPYGFNYCPYCGNELVIIDLKLSDNEVVK